MNSSIGCTILLKLTDNFPAAGQFFRPEVGIDAAAQPL
jgi:hypothetical protein